MIQEKKKRNKKKIVFTLLGIGVLGALVAISAQYFLIPDFDYSVSGDKLTVESYTGTNTEVTIEPTYRISGKQYTTVGIGKDAFKESKITSIELPETLTTIHDHAFFNCTKLKYINLPKNVSEMGEYAFYGCESLKTINIPGSLTQVPNYAFENCSNIKSIKLEEGVEVIGDCGFHNCYAIDLKLPRSLKEIKNNSFSNLDVAEVSLPSNVEMVGFDAFSWNDKLLTVTLPKSLVKIGANAFRNCSRLSVINNLSNLNINNTYDSNITPVINHNLNEITTFKVVNDTGAFIFVKKPNGYSLVGYDWVAENVETPFLYDEGEYHSYDIGVSAFDGAEMQSITLSDDVTAISKYSFRNSCLKECIIGKNVKRVDGYSFSGCSHIQKITYKKPGTWNYYNEKGEYIDKFNMNDPETNIAYLRQIHESGYWAKEE